MAHINRLYLDARSANILRLISAGCSHQQIVDSLRCSENDIFKAAAEALRVCQEAERRDLIAVSKIARNISERKRAEEVARRERCLDAGMDEYVTKPVEVEQLKSVLKKFLGHTSPPPPAVGEGI